MTPTPSVAVEQVEAISALEPCPFCGVRLSEPESVQYPKMGLARLHPGSVTDDDCPLSGWGFYDHRLAAWNTRAAPAREAPSATETIATPGAGMTPEAVLNHFAGRFCRAPLPETVCADPCASISGYQYPRSGTNLLTLVEAKQVLRFVLAGELNYRAYVSSDPDHKPDGTAESLATCASMLETYGPECFPANDQGQIDFTRSMMDATASEIRAFLAHSAPASLDGLAEIEREREAVARHRLATPADRDAPPPVASDGDVERVARAISDAYRKAGTETFHDESLYPVDLDAARAAIAALAPAQRSAGLDARSAHLETALEAIEGGLIPGAGNMVMEGRWKDFVDALQLLARRALSQPEASGEGE